jgi:hypothetical protein
MSLMPCFKPGQAFDEGVILGRLLTGYGELEVVMSSCLIAVEGLLDPPIRMIFGCRGAERRIKIPEDALKSDFTKAGLAADLIQALDDLDWCREIRNQCSHCAWYWTTHEGLCFVNSEELAQQPGTITDLKENKHPINVALLTAQEDFFWYVKQCFNHLDSAYRARNHARSRGGAAGPAPFIYPKPAAQPRPPRHN